MKKLIVVDVQPGYHSYHEHLTPEIVDQISQYDEVLYFFVGREFDLDTKEDVEWYLMEWGSSDKDLEKIEFVQNTSGFFRGWMDTATEVVDLITTFAYEMETQYLEKPYEECVKSKIGDGQPS